MAFSRSGRLRVSSATPGRGSVRRTVSVMTVHVGRYGRRPVQELALATLLTAVGDAVPDREAVVERGGRRATYATFLDRCRRLAAVLAGGGFGAHDGPAPEPWEAGQDLALLLMTNCPEYLEAMVGSFRARVGPANVNYRYTA